MGSWSLLRRRAVVLGGISLVSQPSIVPIHTQVTPYKIKQRARKNKKIHTPFPPIQTPHPHVPNTAPCVQTALPFLPTNSLAKSPNNPLSSIHLPRLSTPTLSPSKLLARAHAVIDVIRKPSMFVESSAKLRDARKA